VHKTILLLSAAAVTFKQIERRFKNDKNYLLRIFLTVEILSSFWFRFVSLDIYVWAQPFCEMPYSWGQGKTRTLGKTRT
jgi:hypothetical protein